MDENNIQEPTIEVLDTESADRAFFNSYLDNRVLVPQTIDDRADAQDALNLSGRIRYIPPEQFDPNGVLEEINDIAKDPKKHPLAHLAAIDALGKLAERTAVDIDSGDFEEVFANFQNSVDRLDAEDTRTFKSVNDAYLHQLILVAALYNCRKLETPSDDQFPVNSQRLSIVAEILRNKRLRMLMPRMTITTRESDTETEELINGYPASRIFLPPERIASDDKMEDACRYWGSELSKDYQLRLPSALITMETDRQRLRSQQTHQDIGRRSNLYYVRLPILEGIETNTESTLSGLSYYLAIMASRKVDEALGRYRTNENPKRVSAGRRAYSENGIRGVVEYEIGSLLEYISMPVPPKRGFSHEARSILGTALVEYSEATGTVLDRDAIIQKLRTSIASSLLVLENASTNEYSYRNMPELSEMLKAQTLSKLRIDDLVFLTREFLHKRGERSSLSPEQLAYVESESVLKELNDILNEIRDRQYLPETTVKEHERTLRAFLENVVQVRFETIRNTQIPENSTEWK